MGVIIGIDAGSPDVRTADHLLAELVAVLGEGAVRFGCTHLTRTGGPHVVVSVELADPDDATSLPAGMAAGTGAAAEAVAAHAARTSGRAVVFPGRDRLVGELSVARVLGLSAVERVSVLAGDPPGPEARVATGDFVRPLWDGGLLTLHTVAAAGGRLAPFEVRNPTPCCVDHA